MAGDCVFKGVGELNWNGSRNLLRRIWGIKFRGKNSVKYLSDERESKRLGNLVWSKIKLTLSEVDKYPRRNRTPSLQFQSS